MQSAHGKFFCRFLGVVFHYLTNLALRNLLLKSNLYLPSYNLNPSLIFLIFFPFSYVWKLFSGFPLYSLSRNKQAQSFTTEEVILAVLSFILALVPSFPATPLFIHLGMMPGFQIMSMFLPWNIRAILLLTALELWNHVGENILFIDKKMLTRGHFSFDVRTDWYWGNCWLYLHFLYILPIYPAVQ